MAKPKVQQILKRLKLDPEFKELRQKAQSDPGNLQYYATEARRRFNLSEYWEALLPHILTLDNFDEGILASGVTIEQKCDPVTGRVTRKIGDHPEASQAEVLRVHGRIDKNYKSKGYTRDIRDSSRDEIEFRALELHKQGMGHTDVADTLNQEFEEGFVNSEVPNLIQQAQKKSIR